ncbi:GNAT family N-acetyltransferase [Actinomyces sp. B33]|uniref:GNAT family N-acetyltransferase n=1 Tax=Actinomyces sp. B33 TaxID=2942131 RepID=UPI00233FE0E6|nr:GNAT family N-acetyltransferase [Actinomyces sp. B33]MDC4233182.1 GNAT family N-acetyltransferase [Actinomyces sp. B33]
MNDYAPPTGEIPLAVRAGAAESVPMPDSHHGVVWEDLTEGHLYALTSLLARIEAQDNPAYRTSRDEVAEMLADTARWRGIAGFATRGMAQGRMVAFAQVALRFPGHVECVCQGGVDPAFRRVGLGGTLVDWQEATARQMLAEIPGSPRAQIVAHVEAGQHDLEEQLKSRGFHWARTYYELRADLADIPEPPMLGRYLSIEPWADEWEEPARRAANLLNEQEWGRPPITEEQWLQGRTSFAPEWSFVAVDRQGDRPRIAGFLLASRYEQDWAALGWKEGYIDQMGVLEEWRLTHAVDALILASMRAQARDGMDRIGAGLGSANRSGALAVYDYLGFRTLGQTRLYAIEV